ncbi:MAG TPA: 50S ribosomal protein L18 [Bacteroidales bacterium]|nr:50S ribosomal protein L18 [Bacteroidales bacterium]
MAIKSKKQHRRFRIKQRIRKTISGTAERPRLSVFRSNKEIYAQLIDDINGRTLAAASSLSKDVAGEESKANKIEQAQKVGNLMAKKAQDAGIDTVVFDRNGYLYHGRIKALAEAVRKGGLKF